MKTSKTTIDQAIDQITKNLDEDIEDLQEIATRKGKDKSLEIKAKEAVRFALSIHRVRGWKTFDSVIERLEYLRKTAERREDELFRKWAYERDEDAYKDAQALVANQIELNHAIAELSMLKGAQ